MMIIPLNGDYKKGKWVNARGWGKKSRGGVGGSVRERENTGKH